MRRKNTANACASYKHTFGAAKGLGFGAGFNYSKEQFVINNTASAFTIPA
jgi:iron complex outermembrane recepter protein